jgi:hypothetical protein
MKNMLHLFFVFVERMDKPEADMKLIQAPCKPRTKGYIHPMALQPNVGP